MKKKTAINIIEKQISKLEKIDKPEKFEYSWKVQTATYIEQFFGSNSHQLIRLKDAPLNSIYSPNLISFLKDCIETINDVGLYKKPKQNFLYSMPNWLAMLLFPLVFTIGIAVGNLQARSQMFKKDNVSLVSDTAVRQPTDLLPENPAFWIPFGNFR